jgi:DNA (cytosine-5)-methyltransferase 1
MPDGAIVTPDIRDAERLQGFPADWTMPANAGSNRRNGPRWRLVGNAVSVPIFRWVGQRLANPLEYDHSADSQLSAKAWPVAAWNLGTGVHAAQVSRWPKRFKRPALAEFLRFPGRPLSLRAAKGFQSRAEASSLRFPKGFLDALARHIDDVEHKALLDMSK